MEFEKYLISCLSKLQIKCNMYKEMKRLKVLN